MWWWWWLFIPESCPTLCDPTDCSVPGFPSFTISRNLLKLKSVESVMPSNHLILYHVHLIFCCPLLFLPSIFPSIRVFPNESVLCISWHGIHDNDLRESWEPVGNADCQAPPRTTGSEILGVFPAICV